MRMNGPDTATVVLALSDDGGVVLSNTCLCVDDMPPVHKHVAVMFTRS